MHTSLAESLRRRKHDPAGESFHNGINRLFQAVVNFHPDNRHVKDKIRQQFQKIVKFSFHDNALGHVSAQTIFQEKCPSENTVADAWNQPDTWPKTMNLRAWQDL